MGDTREAALRDALWDFAHGEGPRIDLLAHSITNSHFVESTCQWVFDRAHIAIPDEVREAVVREFRRLPFYGGNFTLDARRLLKALATPEEARRG